MIYRMGSGTSSNKGLLALIIIAAVGFMLGWAMMHLLVVHRSSIGAVQTTRISST